jgi:hypothetical protein
MRDPQAIEGKTFEFRQHFLVQLNSRLSLGGS